MHSPLKPSSTCHPEGMSTDMIAGDFLVPSPPRSCRDISLLIISSKGGLGLPVRTQNEQ